MDKKLIIFGSKYGSTSEYAKELSSRTGISSIKYNKIHCLEDYNTIIYLGGLYAGGVLGLKKTFEKFPLKPYQKLIIITVGLSDPNVSSNIDNIKNSLIKQLSKELYEKSKVFHLRGAIDYSKLNLAHKLMMKALYTTIKKLPVEEQTEENKEFISSYKKDVNFVDFESLNEIIEYINS